MRSILFLFLIVSLSSCSIINSGKQGSKPSGSETQKTRTLGQVVSDTRISAGIHVDLLALELYKPVDVKVKKGTVILTGTVSSVKDSFAASGVAWKQNGVKEVINKLKVAKNK